MFGRHGEGRGELDCPTSITIDTSDRVYVGDWNHCMSVFTSEGQFLTSFGQEREGPGEFKYSHGLAVDVSGVVYVRDHNNDRIQLLCICINCYSEFNVVHHQFTMTVDLLMHQIGWCVRDVSQYNLSGTLSPNAWVCVCSNIFM